MGCGSSKDARGETATTSGIGTYPSCVIEWCRGLDAIFTFGRGATVLGTYASRAYAVDKDECCVRLATSTTVPRKPKGCGQRGWVEARERVNQSVVGSLDSLECLSAPTGLSCASPAASLWIVGLLGGVDERGWTQLSHERARHLSCVRQGTLWKP